LVYAYAYNADQVSITVFSIQNVFSIQSVFSICNADQKGQEHLFVYAHVYIYVLYILHTHTHTGCTPLTTRVMAAFQGLD
jgi:drug/metabolite transporter superfamily protein YnfA